MRLEFTDQDFELFWLTMGGQEYVTEDMFVDLCRNGCHINDEDITKEEKRLSDEGKSEIRMKNN